MNILVCIKQVPSSTEVDIDEKTGVLRRAGIESKINPYDLYAIEAAAQLKDKYKATVHTITMGPPQAKEIIKEAFMMGVDDGIMISDSKFAGADVLATAYTLAQGIKKLPKSDLIICGKQTTDGDTAQVGPEIANFLNIPHAAYIKNIIELDETSITVETDMDKTTETIRIKLPCLITVDSGIGQARLPSFIRKLHTQNKKIPTYKLNDFEDKDENKYGLTGSPTQVIKIFPPPSNDEHEIWEGKSEELSTRIADKLTELKFI
jgi:electron transfer flavoprotein beta subunit